MIPTSRGKREKHSPATLKHLAANKAVETLFHTTKNLHHIISRELSKSKVEDIETPGGSAVSDSSGTRTASTNSEISHFSVSSSIPRENRTYDFKNVRESLKSIAGANNNQKACTDAAYRVFHVRKYMKQKLCPATHPILLEHTIAKAMETNDIPLVRLVIDENTEVLDFRARDYYLHRSVVPHSSSKMAPPPKNKSTVDNSLVSYSLTNAVGIQSSSTVPSGTQLRSKSYSVLQDMVPKFSPPDEHDWFSRDKMGKIVSLSDACELFSVTKMAQCAQTVKEFYINATRPVYWAASREILPVISETLMLFSSLTTLVLRGMADDYMLQIIGETSTELRHLDVSGSKFVTDDGIRNLFFSDLKQNQAMYMIASWVNKNLDKLNPLSKTLEYFDCSWTNVTSISRKIVGIIPGSYVFRRFFAKTEDEAYGQFIFIRKPPEYTNKIQPKLGKEWSVAFEAQIQSYTGPKGLKGMCRFLESHPWNNGQMHLFIQDGSFVKGNHLEDNPTCSGLITPNETERRIYGSFTFFCGNVTELYSIFPINVNLVGECFPKLKILRGNLTDTWRMKCSLLPELTDVEIFAAPTTIVSLFEFCPNVKRVKLRIVKEFICDDHLLQSIPSSMCRRTLEELWIAPGVYIQKESAKEDQENTLSSNTAFEKDNNEVENNSPESKSFIGVDLAPENSNFYLDDLVHLSMHCLRSLVRECKSLRRLGDISWWTLVSKPEFLSFCDELKAENVVMALLWENELLPEHDFTNYN